MKIAFSEREDEDCYLYASKIKFSWECAIYDPYLLKFIGCRKNYYLMNDHCC